ncbi:MAG: circularly permuted type 2 ATP-grasp protein, partial [Gallionella sp.]
MNAQNVFDEMYRGDGEIGPAYQGYHAWLERIPADQLEQKRNEAEALFKRLGITFAVYGEDAGSERLIPFDIIPRIISASEWRLLSAGSCQRIRALNAFLHDIYHDQEIIRAGRIPAQQVLGNRLYRAEMQGLDLTGEIYAHIAGIDIVRVAENQFYVLEDNLRTPSGVSYMLENRRMMMRLFPELFASQSIAPVDHYPQVLLDNLRAVAPRGMHDPVVVLLS